LLHLPAQRLHLSHVESGIMSHHDHIGGFKDTVERRDEFFLSRSIHCKLFPVGDPCTRRPVTARCPGLTLHKRRQDGAAQILPLKRTISRTRNSRFKPVAGLSAPKRSPPSVQATDIKPRNGTCSLGQDALPETAGSGRRAREKFAIGFGSFQRNPAGCPKGISPNRHVFLEARKGAPTNPGPARPDPYVERSGAFAKHETRKCRDFCAAAVGPNLVIAAR